MDLQLLLIGLGIGLAVAVPVGPINLMVIRHAIKGGFREGIFTGLGAVVGDGFFALVVAFGLTAVSSFIADYEQGIRFVGGSFLLILGLRTMLANPNAHALAVSREGDNGIGNHIALLGTTFLLTVTNPATLMGFVFIFSAAGVLVLGSGGYWDASVLVVAVMIGSLAWWAILAGLVSYFRDQLSLRALKRINQGSGGMLALFGVAVLGSVAWSLMMSS